LISTSWMAPISSPKGRRWYRLFRHKHQRGEEIIAIVHKQGRRGHDRSPLAAKLPNTDHERGCYSRGAGTNA
jgi:hypothetical protein